LRQAIRDMIPDADPGHITGSETDLESIARLFSDLVREREASHRALDNQKFALDQHAAVSIADARGVITYANEKFSELSGFDVEELVGNTHKITASGLHTAAFYQEMWQTISKGRVWHGEFVNRHKNGSLYWVAATIVPWLDAEGRPYQYVAIRTDITAQKRVEQALEDARRREVQTGLEIQRALLISDLPEGIRGADLAARAEPSQGIDGDFCAFSTYGPDRFELLVGDVMGKGVPAALVGAALRMITTTPGYKMSYQQATAEGGSTFKDVDERFERHVAIDTWGTSGPLAGGTGFTNTEMWVTMMAAILATELVLGRDAHCLNYIRASRKGIFDKPAE